MVVCLGNDEFRDSWRGVGFQPQADKCWCFSFLGLFGVVSHTWCSALIRPWTFATAGWIFLLLI